MLLNVSTSALAKLQLFIVPDTKMFQSNALSQNLRTPKMITLSYFHIAITPGKITLDLFEDRKVMIPCFNIMRQLCSW